ncbi:MAG: response regulator, partial [Planctomycetes bacterium]|nr:response regulator [Planctomycetota bacterium]
MREARAPGTVLVVDDEAAARLGMRRALEADAHRVVEAPDGEAALAALEAAPADLVFLDINMPGQDGLEVLSRIRGRPRAPPVVMVTAHGSERVAVEAMKRGAYDYLAKPYDVEELRLVARRALDHDALARENRALRESLAEGRAFGSLVGDSEPMCRLYEALARVAATDATAHADDVVEVRRRQLLAQQVHLLAQLPGLEAVAEGDGQALEVDGLG